MLFSRISDDVDSGGKQQFFRLFFAYFAHQNNFADRNNFVSYDKPYIYIFVILSPGPTRWIYSFLYTLLVLIIVFS